MLVGTITGGPNIRLGVLGSTKAVEGAALPWRKDWNTTATISSLKDSGEDHDIQRERSPF